MVNQDCSKEKGPNLIICRKTFQSNEKFGIGSSHRQTDDKKTCRLLNFIKILSHFIQFPICCLKPHNSCLAVLLFSSLATCTQDKHRIFSDFDPNTLHYFCLCCPFTFIMKYTKHFRRNARFSMGVCVDVAHIYDMECVFQR